MTRLIFACLLVAQSALAKDVITIQSTTSTQNAGFYDAILPLFTDDTGLRARVIAVGTGQAIKNMIRCDGDILIAHATTAENHFVETGHGLARYDLMYNDFVIVGPTSDPAGVSKTGSASNALRTISRAKAPFVSRADNSGTHQKEMGLWASSDTDPIANSGTWYRETGSGMGATLNTAIAMNAYTLVDRATWLTFGNRRAHQVLIENDPALFNQYGVTVVHPHSCPNSNQSGAHALQSWLLSDRGQTAISEIAHSGEPLFTPNAR